MAERFPHLYEHNQLVKVVDPAHAHYGRCGEIWAISLDTIKERNPNGEVTYTLELVSGGQAHVYERQIAPA